MDEEKIRTIKEWKKPTNVQGIQSFLGFANFYRRFIRDTAKSRDPYPPSQGRKKDGNGVINNKRHLRRSRRQ